MGQLSSSCAAGRAAAPIEMNGALRVRLRTQNGDLGPVDAAGTETVGELKSRLLGNWSRLTAGM